MVKHSGAHSCRIVLEAADSSCTLVLEDDGRGPVGKGTGTGLGGLILGKLGVRTRAEAVGLARENGWL